jgi:hypothetical protein
MPPEQRLGLLKSIVEGGDINTVWEKAKSFKHYTTAEEILALMLDVAEHDTLRYLSPNTLSPENIHKNFNLFVPFGKDSAVSMKSLKISFKQMRQLGGAGRQKKKGNRLAPISVVDQINFVTQELSAKFGQLATLVNTEILGATDADCTVLATMANEIQDDMQTILVEDLHGRQHYYNLTAKFITADYLTGENFAEIPKDNWKMCMVHTH